MGVDIDGVPCVVAFLFILLASKELSISAAVVAVILVTVLYPAIPLLLLRFYRAKSVVLTFETRSPAAHRLERLPLSILVLAYGSAIYIWLLHVLMFFNGLFPLGISWATGLEGIILLDLSILCLACLVRGVLACKKWAWWASLLYYATMTVLWLGALTSSSWAHLLEVLDFPPYEVAFLRNIPLQGWHLAMLPGTFLVLMLVASFRSRDSFYRPSP